MVYYIILSMKNNTIRKEKTDLTDTEDHGNRGLICAYTYSSWHIAVDESDQSPQSTPQ